MAAARSFKRAVLLPNRTVDLAGITIEVVFFNIPNEAEQARERIFTVNRFAFEHAARDFEQHPHVPLGIAHRLHGLFEHRGAALRIAELALAFHPHCHGENDVGILGRKRRIHFVHRDERVENTRVLAVFAQETRQIRQRLRPVVVCAPQEIDVAFRHFTEELDRVIAGRFDFVEVAFGQIPNGFGIATMRLVGHHEVGRQAMAERAHLARRSACARLSGERKCR